jgi:hypothetical protein
MKVLQVLLVLFCVAVGVSAQKTILTGTVYDANGAVIVKSKVAAVNPQGEKFEALTNNEGIYELNLPYKRTSYFKAAKYDVTVEAHGFETLTLKDFKVIGGFTGKMQLDLALDVLVMIQPVSVPFDSKDSSTKINL